MFIFPPNCIVPRATSLTITPVLPSLRYFISLSPLSFFNIGLPILSRQYVPGVSRQGGDSCIIPTTIQGGRSPGKRSIGSARSLAACIPSPNDAPHTRVRRPGRRVLPPRPHRRLHVPSFRRRGRCRGRAPAARCVRGMCSPRITAATGSSWRAARIPAACSRRSSAAGKATAPARAGPCISPMRSLGHMGANAIVGRQHPHLPRRRVLHEVPEDGRGERRVLR